MIINGSEVKEKLLKGIDIVANTVKPTLGPQAKTVILQGNPPVVINDGVTITKYISDEDPYVQMGIQLVQNLASKAQEGSGDGTTTACILAQALCHNMLDAPEMNVHQFNNRIESLKLLTIQFLDKEAQEVDDGDITNIATIAANNDSHLGSLIAEAIDKVGRDGIITVEESKTHNTEIVVRKGLEIDEGYMSHLMANSEDGKCTFDSPLIFLSNLAIRNFSEILPMMEHAASKNLPLVIFCKGMEGNAMNNVVMNLLQKTIEVAVITAPNFGDAQLDELADIAGVVGGTVYTDESKDDPKKIHSHTFGSCDTITITKDKTIFVGGNRPLTENRITTLKGTLEDSQDEYDKLRLKKRIARLSGGVATIKVGASSSIEMREKKERLDDALNATKAALEEGIIVGGGLTLAKVAKKAIKGTKHCGWFELAMQEPMKVLQRNSGIDNPSVSFGKKDMGFNALTGSTQNLRKAGVFDPVKVTKNSFLAAMSIAQLFYSTDVAVLLPEE
jgi:chaperonin GroEL